MAELQKELRDVAVNIDRLNRKWIATVITRDEEAKASTANELFEALERRKALKFTLESLKELSTKSVDELDVAKRVDELDSITPDHKAKLLELSIRLRSELTPTSAGQGAPTENHGHRSDVEGLPYHYNQR
ncbi:hypothetical protein IFR05_000097 [Cadophora sp. M221]|nr:hypothetical protein IFR05_000097 [Cadophora sp. M221]